MLRLNLICVCVFVMQGKGYEIARGIWTDEILAAPPKHLQDLLSGTDTSSAALA
jgi:hypothetical protein